MQHEICLAKGVILMFTHTHTHMHTHTHTKHKFVQLNVIQVMVFWVVPLCSDVVGYKFSECHAASIFKAK